MAVLGTKSNGVRRSYLSNFRRFAIILPSSFVLRVLRRQEGQIARNERDEIIKSLNAMYVLTRWLLNSRIDVHTNRTNLCVIQATSLTLA